ncbi:reverse transcriptase domain-containing protein [Tanacetum coccineum]
MFLGYQVNTEGIKICPDKVDAVLSLQSPKCLKDVQKLNGKLASLNRFLAKSAEKSLPFFKTLKKMHKKSDFLWTEEAEAAFKQMKEHIAKLPMLTAPEEQEELIVYLAASKEAVSAVLMTEREAKQMPIYFVSRALRGPEINYTAMEKLVLALVQMQQKDKKIHFQAHRLSQPNTTNSRITKPDKGQTPDIPKTHVSIFKAAPLHLRGHAMTAEDHSRPQRRLHVDPCPTRDPLRPPTVTSEILGNPNYLSISWISARSTSQEQTVMIGSDLTEKTRSKLCNLLQRSLDIFAWTLTDMTGVPRQIAEHKLNVKKGCPPVRQKKRGQAAERNIAINDEVSKLVTAGIVREVHYHDWLSNPVMVKKSDNSWRMCVDFKDLNKACPKDGYPIPEIDWKVNIKGIKICPDKVNAVLSLQSPKCLKDVQKLNGKLASLNKFLAKSAEKSLPFFKTLKKCTKKSDFLWKEEAEAAFKQMKENIAKLPMLTAPKEQEELIVYLAASKEAVSAVLMTERKAKQMPIYFVSRALRGPKINYTAMEKLVLALVQMQQKDKKIHFQAHRLSQ